MMNNIRGIQTTLDKTYEWIKILMQDHAFANENKAFLLLRATLKALRDRIPVEEAVHLGSHLPVLLRGFYYEGWDPFSKTEKAQDIYDFIGVVGYHLKGHEDIELEMAVPVTMKLIFDMIDQSEAEEVRNCLPKEIREIIPS